MSERISNLGYCMLKEQSASNTPVTPTVTVPLISESLSTVVNLDDQISIIGNRAARQDVVRGQRSHSGSIEVLGEPNTLVYLLSMLMKRGSKSGNGPYTYPFTVDEPTQEFTIDLLRGDVVFRYWGVKASKFSPSFSDNKMHVSLDVSALGSFIVREISTITGVGPYTITLKTNYDSNATKGLVAADVMTGLKVSTGVKTNFAVASVSGLTTITTITDVSTLGVGDLIYLRAQTPSLSILEPLIWSRTEFRLAADAATALSATHTPMEKGSGYSINFPFMNAEGEKRSGYYDPLALVKSLADADVTLKKFFDTPEDLNRFLTAQDRALVVRHFGETISGTETELRVTFNTLNWKEKPISLKHGEIIYAEGSLVPSYNVSDGQIYDITLINNISL